MFDYNAMGTYVLVVTLATVFVIVLVARQRRSQKDIAIWLISGLVGIILGAAGAAGIMQVMGYDWAKKFVMLPESELTSDVGIDGEEGGGMDDPGGMSGMGGSGGMGGPGGRGGGRGPSPKGQLTTLVRKVDLLTGDIALNLSDEQGAKLAEILGKMKSQETMTDEDATALNEEILAVFDPDQKAKQEAVSLPRGGRGGGGPGGGGPGGGGSGGEEENEDANPFSEERNAAAIDALLERFGEPADDAPVSDPKPVETEATDTEPTDPDPKETTTDQAKPSKE